MFFKLRWAANIISLLGLMMVTPMSAPAQALAEYWATVPILAVVVTDGDGKNLAGTIRANVESVRRGGTNGTVEVEVPNYPWEVMKIEVLYTLETLYSGDGKPNGVKLGGSATLSGGGTKETRPVTVIIVSTEDPSAPFSGNAHLQILISLTDGSPNEAYRIDDATGILRFREL